MNYRQAHRKALTVRWGIAPNRDNVALSNIIAMGLRYELNSETGAVYIAQGIRSGFARHIVRLHNKSL